MRMLVLCTHTNAHAHEEEKTYPSPLLCVRSGKSATALELILVHCHFIIMYPIGLEGLSLGHLFGHGVFLVQDRSSYPHKCFLVLALNVDHIFHFM